METPAKTFIILARQIQLNQENIFNNAPFRWIAIAMKTNSAFTRPYTENPIWYQQFDLRQIRILKSHPPYVDFDAADNCCLYFSTRKPMNFKNFIPSTPIDNSNYHFELVFDLSSKEDATENCQYPELVGEPLRLELNFTSPIENVTQYTVLGERTFSVAIDKLCVDGNLM